MQTCDEDRPWEIGVVAPHVLPRRGWCVEGALCRQAALGASAHAVCTARVLRWLPWDFQTHMGRRGVRPRCTHAAKEPLSRGSGSSVSPVGSPLESGVSPAHIGPSNACPRAAPETTPLWTLFLIKLSLSLSLSPGAPGLSRGTKGGKVGHGTLVVTSRVSNTVYSGTATIFVHRTTVSVPGRRQGGSCE